MAVARYLSLSFRYRGYSLCQVCCIPVDVTHLAGTHKLCQVITLQAQVLLVKCLVLQAYLHVQWLRFQHVSA